MQDQIESIIAEVTGAEKVVKEAVLQRLWSGYGSIVRYALQGAEVPSVIVKHVSPPTECAHPRGWNTDLSHQRKLKSYIVESVWYQKYANRCGQLARVPKCLAVERWGDTTVIILEDLDVAGYPGRRSELSEEALRQCITWLAHFHATFLGDGAAGLWARGTYWHLDTRPDELAVLKKEDTALHAAAAAIDAKLKSSAFQTLVHGDAKLANFCFASDGNSVAAVDFQYVGSGCGMQDLAYFIGSCLCEEACSLKAPGLLDGYFAELRLVLDGRSFDVEALEADWRALYPVAWTDFHRFLKGWSPGHWKVHSYSERLAREVVSSL